MIAETAKGPERAPLAVIDVGSNAVRMLIAEIDEGGDLCPLEDLQRTVALGRDAFTDGYIRQETINEVIAVIRGFQRVMEPYGVGQLRAVATSAVREADNQDLFLQRVFMATNIPVEVVTSSEEHRLLYLAVHDIFASEGLRAQKTSLIVELGSGTAELAMFQSGRSVFSGSYPLGTLRLRNNLGVLHPAPGQVAHLLRRQIAPPLEVIEQGSPLSQVQGFIGLGSDLRFVAEHISPHTGEPGHVRVLKRKAFLKFVEQVCQLRPEDIARKYGLPYRDSELLTPALIFYSELLKRTPAQEVRVPSVSMRDGLILDMVAERTEVGVEDLEQQIYFSAEHLAERYQYDSAHAHNVANLACQIFDQLRDEHQLGTRDRRLLRVAAILHDIGNFISNRSHHKHSEYIIRASDIFGLHADEKELIAQIVRYHRRALPKKTHPNYQGLTRGDRARVSKLAAILRLADGLACGRTGKILTVDCDLRANELILSLDTPEELSLERLVLRTKGNLFEEVYGRKVVLQD